MGNQNINVELPPVLDEENNPMSVEDAEASLRKARHIQVKIDRSEGRRTYTVAVDLNNIDGVAISAYELFKSEYYAVLAGPQRRTRNSKLTQPKELEDENDSQMSGEAAIKAAKMRPRERAIFMDLLYPKDWKENPVVLASNLSDMPTDDDECFAWFQRGGLIASEVMDAVVMAIDPTGPLAQTKTREVSAREMEAQLMAAFQEKLADIQQVPIPAEVSNALGETAPPMTESPSSDTTQPQSSSSPQAEAGDTESLDAPSSSVSAAP